MLYKVAIASAVASASAYSPTAFHRPSATAHRVSTVQMAEATKTKREVDLAQYRNFGIMAHIDAGKTCARAAFGVHCTRASAARAA